MKIPQWKKNFDERKIISKIKFAIKNKSFSEGKFTKEFELKKLDTIEIGKILKITDKYILTRCSDCLIRLYFKNKEKFKKGEIKYIYDPLFYLFNSKHALLELKKIL